MQAAVTTSYCSVQYHWKFEIHCAHVVLCSLRSSGPEMGWTVKEGLILSGVYWPGTSWPMTDLEKKRSKNGSSCALTPTDWGTTDQSAVAQIPSPLEPDWTEGVHVWHLQIKLDLWPATAVPRSLPSPTPPHPTPPVLLTHCGRHPFRDACIYTKIETWRKNKVCFITIVSGWEISWFKLHI